MLVETECRGEKLETLSSSPDPGHFYSTVEMNYISLKTDNTLTSTP